MGLLGANTLWRPCAAGRLMAIHKLPSFPWKRSLRYSIAEPNRVCKYYMSVPSRHMRVRSKIWQEKNIRQLDGGGSIDTKMPAVLVPAFLTFSLHASRCFQFFKSCYPFVSKYFLCAFTLYQTHMQQWYRRGDVFTPTLFPCWEFEIFMPLTFCFFGTLPRRCGKMET